MVLNLERHDAVKAMTAVLIILFEYADLLENTSPVACQSLKQAMEILGGLTNDLVLDEYMETGNLIPKPRFIMGDSVDDDVVGALVSLEDVLLYEISPRYHGPEALDFTSRIENAVNEIKETVNILLLEGRQTESTNSIKPWEYLHAEIKAEP